MNWILFAILAWVLIGCETGLKSALALGQTGVAPSFVFPLVAFIAVTGTNWNTYWAALILGLMVDLTWTVGVDGGGPPATIVGPNALGFLLGAQLILTIRGLVIRRNPLAIGFLALVGFALAQVVVVALMTTKDLLGDPVAWSATRELISRLGAALYTGILGFVLALIFLPLAPLFGLQAPQQRRFSVRRP